MKTFGSRLRGLREDKDITTMELAESLHITTRTLNYYETDKREPDYATLVKIADYFDVPLDYLKYTL
jgi:transcriptional regulator with XRE-family HTH domain